MASTTRRHHLRHRPNVGDRQIRIEPTNRLTDRRCERRWCDRRLDHKSHGTDWLADGLVPLRVRHVELFLHYVGDAVVTDVLHDADDGHPWTLGSHADAEPAADRIPARPVSSRHLLVDQRDELPVAAFSFARCRGLESPARPSPRCSRRSRSASRPWRWSPVVARTFDAEAEVADRRSQRQRSRRARGLDARQIAALDRASANRSSQPAPAARSSLPAARSAS